MTSAALPKPRSKSESLARRKLVLSVLSYVVLVLLAFFFLFPLIFMLMSAFKTNPAQLNTDIGNVNAFLPVGQLGVENFAGVIDRFSPANGKAGFFRLFFNSGFVTAMIVMLGLVVNSSFAYALARMQFWGRNFLITLVVSLIIIPFQAVAIPLMLMTYNAGLANSYIGLILPFIAHAFSIYLFYQFFIGLPKELEEAAFVDGASRLRIYWSVVLPLSGPVFATVAVLQFLAQWGQLLWPVLILNARVDLYTLPLEMQGFFGQGQKPWGQIMAYTLMTTLPTLVMFIFFQRWFVRSAVSSGVKG